MMNQILAQIVVKQFVFIKQNWFTAIYEVVIKAATSVFKKHLASFRKLTTTKWIWAKNAKKINIQSGQHVTRVKEIEQRHLCDVFSEFEEFCFCLHTQTRVVTLKECNNSNAKISISSNLTSFFFLFCKFCTISLVFIHIFCSVSF